MNTHRVGINIKFVYCSVWCFVLLLTIDNLVNMLNTCGRLFECFVDH